jgi:integrase/recombinase XerC
MNQKLHKKHNIWLNKFLNNCVESNKSPHTIKNYRSDLERFLLWYEITNHTTIDRKRQGTIESYKEFLLKGGKINTSFNLLRVILNLFLFKLTIQVKSELRTSPLSVNSAKRHLSSIKNFYEYLKQTHEGHSSKFKHNPVKTKIHSIKVKEIDIASTVLIPKEEWRVLIESTHRTRERLILQLLYWGGLRLSELTQLRYSYFDHKTKILRIPRKGGYLHEFRIQNEDQIFKNVNFMYKNKVNDSDFIFTNYEHNCLSSRSMYNIIKKLLENNGCNKYLTPHSFRKACATNLYEKTKDLLLVRDYLNHHDAKVTQTYIETKGRPII